MAGKYVLNAVVLFGVLFFRVYSELYCSQSSTALHNVNTEFYQGAYIKIIHEESVLLGYKFDSFTAFSLVECALACLRVSSTCHSINFRENGNGAGLCELSSTAKDSAQMDEFIYDKTSTYLELLIITEVYCDGPWMLIARFSNNDDVNWMKAEATWWYDITEAQGNKLSPSENQDMISDGFWLKQGTEFRVTRSDDPSHTTLLSTTGNCLNGMTFREKMASYGTFRDTDTWSVDQCLGQCSVTYGGDFRSVDGFNQSECNGSIQSANQIGMWCDFGVGDGSVIMIGGGGLGCARADHGIGLTEENDASFKDGFLSPFKFDFGGNSDDIEPPTKAYALNLWVRL